ncbi:MAG: hypothetical protein ACRDJI_11190 [Actinomycetota bacterium]
MRSRTLRTLALLATATLVVGAFAAGPAEAKKKCRPYKPGTLGAEAETTKVTDAATEEAPIEVELDTAPGLGFTNADDPSGDTGPTSHAFHNVQVDSKAASAGLYVRVEFLPTWDYDLYLRAPSGPSVAYEADFNQAAGAGLGANQGGHAEQGASQIDGYLAADCAGFTVDLASSSSAGGAATMTLWLGDPGR